ncbi:MAG TPA: TolC family protein [Polyangiaceae bacterium]|nr:TolC family protein [Polyangiaceae bacterium]
MRRSRRLLPLLALLSWAAPSVAAERRVPFREAVGAGDQNPRVVSTRQASESLSRAEQKSPSLDANPVVTGAVGPRVAPASERGVDWGVGLSQSFSVHGAAARRREGLAAEAEWLRADADAELVARRIAAASAWLTLWEAERQVALTQEDVTNEERLLALVKRLAEVQERTAADVATVETRLAESKLRERLAEGTLVEAKARLSAEMHAARDDDLVTDGALPELPMPERAEALQLIARAASLPAVRARQLLSRAEQARAREERAGREARLSFGIDFRHESPGANIVQANAIVPLPIFAVGAREYASRMATSLRASGEAADEAMRAREAMRLAVHELEHSQEVFELLDARLVPSAERAIQLRERQLKGGEGTLLEVIDARRTFLDARLRWLSAAKNRAWARIQVELLARAAAGNGK